MGHPYDEFSDEGESDMSDDYSEATEIISCPSPTNLSRLNLTWPTWKVHYPNKEGS